jgi:hypothetical protein
MYLILLFKRQRNSKLQSIYPGLDRALLVLELPLLHADYEIGFNWYATERVIRNTLVNKGIDTYVYYYKRKDGGAPKFVKQHTTPIKLKSSSQEDKSSMESSHSTSEDEAVISLKHTTPQQKQSSCNRNVVWLI